jgi:secreted trypsin-like serine protease
VPLHPQEQDLGRGGLLALLIGLAACAASTDSAEKTGQTSQAITQGATDSGDPAVVALLGLSGPYCSGTLVTPYIVVTAGHCASPAPDQVLFGADGNGNGTKIDVALAHHHPQFSSSTLANDIGIVALKTAAPAAPVRRGTAPVTVGQAIRIVGFGSTGLGDTTALKHSGNTTIDTVKDTSFDLGPHPSQTCNGDSGGAAFDHDGALIGVTSDGDIQCQTFGRDMRVDAFASFIDSEIAAYKPPADPTNDGGCALIQTEPDATSFMLVIAVVVALVVVRRRSVSPT